MAEIKASVGDGGQNDSADVRLVQKLLNEKGFRVGVADGVCGKRTGTAITSFQHGFLKKPDGRVDPGGKTWKALSKPGAAPATQGGPLVRKLAKPDPASINCGLSAVNNAMMTQMFGAPRIEGDYDQKGKPVTNPLLKRNMLTSNVGPFRVTGLNPAVLSLQQVLQEVQKSQPEVYSGLSHRGMLVVRFQRDSTTRISNHGWGCAIDLAINGVLDDRGDNMTQYGLTLIAPIFNKFGWYWGASFPTEDSMHFEGSVALTKTWRASLK